VAGRPADDASDREHGRVVGAEFESDVGVEVRRAPVRERDAFVEAAVDVALAYHLQVAGRELEPQPAGLAAITDRLGLDPDPIDEQEQPKLGQQARVAQPQPVAIRARRRHRTARGRHREASVLFEDRALAAQDLRAWAGAAGRCEASKAGLVPTA
jgi:hypothetical protein